MITVTKEFTFDAGHRLMRHKGACKNLHGHTYKLQVSFSNEYLDENDMIMDFKKLKEVVAPIINEFDHAMILNQDDDKIIELCKSNDFKYVLINGDPTAENMCLFIGSTIEKNLVELGDNVYDISIKLWETPTSFAEVTNA